MAGKSSRSDRRAPRQERRVRATRRKLLDAARTVFAERGLDMARIDEITDRADVGKGTFYYHFRNKPQLIRELIKDVLDELATALEQRCSGIGELEGLLDALIRAHIEFFCNRWEDFVLYFQGRSDLTLQESFPGIETPFLDYLERLETLLASVLKYRLPQPVLRRMACAVAGLLSGYYSFAAISSQDEDIDATFSSLRGAMVASLARFIQEAAPPPASEESRDQMK